MERQVFVVELSEKKWGWNVIERTIDIKTKDGECSTFIVHPDRGSPHPAILFLGLT